MRMTHTLFTCDICDRTATKRGRPQAMPAGWARFAARDMCPRCASNPQVLLRYARFDLGRPPTYPIRLRKDQG